MSSSWLYQQDPLWIVVALMAAMTLTAEVGFQLGRRWHPGSDDVRRGHFGSIVGPLLGLLALLLSFTASHELCFFHIVGPKSDVP